MKDLVFLKSNQPVTTSLIIAEGTGNEHRSIIRLIQNYQPQFERWGKVKFADVDLKSAANFIEGAQDNNRRLSNDGRGKPTKVAYLNEQQATFLGCVGKIEQTKKHKQFSDKISLKVEECLCQTYFIT